MTQIKNAFVQVEKPADQILQTLNVKSWDVWTKEPGSFDWNYDEKEVCYFLEGEVTVKTPKGTVSFGKGDLVTFPKGLSCTWIVHKSVKKHYRFGE